MGVVESILNFLLIFLIINGIFNYLVFSRAKKAAQKIQEDNAQLKLEVKEEIEMVTDYICGRTLPKSEAYILANDDQKHYFCSWDCREKFIAGNQV
ncbi:TRASH domain-containing protein [Desulfoscipio gibsoniae]|uniref:MYM-type Zinc finger with FCS sequence motif n=1 Tax=Desulfoscipio gibsoniae DSM 7213 TaxID=767817 RepID=R4KD30_9FIRM|nr:TRASH domain-containing protein [Desulfoscipio gibsoniae]AGL01078.1 MYM-type Zinc finger with FCS sequence motif [Desulfoscipio gibsoniae DSM 7213]